MLVKVIVDDRGRTTIEMLVGSASVSAAQEETQEHSHSGVLSKMLPAPLYELCTIDAVTSATLLLVGFRVDINVDNNSVDSGSSALMGVSYDPISETMTTAGFSTPGSIAQSYVTTVTDALGQFSAGLSEIDLASACQASTIPGRGQLPSPAEPMKSIVFWPDSSD